MKINTYFPSENSEGGKITTEALDYKTRGEGSSRMIVHVHICQGKRKKSLWARWSVPKILSYIIEPTQDKGYYKILGWSSGTRGELVS